MNSKDTSSICTQNKKACKYFVNAYNAFSRKDFILAQDMIHKYRELISYHEFYKNDNRQFSNPLLSVIVVTFNTNFKLIQCINSILIGTLDQVEIIIVDNGKNDKVYDILHLLPILYIKTPQNLFPSEGRNIGVSFANSPIAVFLDDDAVAHKDFCQNILIPFKNSQVHAVRGKILPKNEDSFKISAAHYDLGNQPCRTVIDTEGNSAWRIKSYKELGGMDPLLFGHEGLDLSQRLYLYYGRPATYYFPDIIIFHDYASSVQKNTIKEDRHSKMSEYVHWKNKQSLKNNPQLIIKYITWKVLNYFWRIRIKIERYNS